MHLDIIFRSCSQVAAVHGGNRFIDVSKEELILTCLSSLIRSANVARASLPELSLSLTVIDDHSAASCVEALAAPLRNCPWPTRFVRMETTGNGASLRVNYEYARRHCRELIYFSEDDYLYMPAALTEMVEMHIDLKSRFGQEPVIFPCDYPDRYQDPYLSYIVLGTNRYWRSIRHTTATCLTTRGVLEKNWENYIGLAAYGIDPQVSEDSTINRVYEKTPCFSPMPSLAIHMQYAQSLSPFVNWKQLWEQSKLPAARGIE